MWKYYHALSTVHGACSWPVDAREVRHHWGAADAVSWPVPTDGGLLQVWENNHRERGHQWNVDRPNHCPRSGPQGNLGCPQGLESLGKLEFGQINSRPRRAWKWSAGLRPLKILKWALKFLKILKFLALFVNHTPLGKVMQSCHLVTSPWTWIKVKLETVYIIDWKIYGIDI